MVGTVPLDSFEAISECEGDLLLGLTLDRRFRRSLKNGIAIVAFARLLCMRK